MNLPRPKRIPKALLHEIVAESRRCGIGPRELGRVLRLSHEYLSRIAVDDLHLAPLAQKRKRCYWSETLRDLVGRTVAECGEQEVIATRIWTAENSTEPA